MSRNIPVNEEIFTEFSSMKKALIELNETKEKITNDTFIKMMMNDFSQKNTLIEYITKNSLLKKEVKNNGKKVK